MELKEVFTFGMLSCFEGNYGLYGMQNDHTSEDFRKILKVIFIISEQIMFVHCILPGTPRLNLDLYGCGI